MFERGKDGRFVKRYDAATASRNKVRLFRGDERAVVKYPTPEEEAEPMVRRILCLGDRAYTLNVAQEPASRLRSWGGGINVVSLDHRMESPDETYAQPFNDRVDEIFCTEPVEKKRTDVHLATVY